MNLEKKIWRGFRKTILPLVAASLLYSCPFPTDSRKPEKETLTAQVPETVKLFSNSDSDKIYSVKEDRIIFSEEIENLSTGDIIVCGITPSTPNGLLRRVSSINPYSQVAFTTQATIPELAKDYSAHFSKRLIPDEARSVSLGRGVIATPRTTELFDFNYNLDKTIDIDGNLFTKYDQFNITGNISLNSNIDFNWDIDDEFRLKKFEFKNTTSNEIDITASALENLSGLSKTIVIANYKFPPITFATPTTPPIPVVICPVLEIDLNLSGGITPVSLNLNQNADLILGLKYSGNWSPIYEFENSFNSRFLQVPSLELLVNPTQRLSANFYGVAGPYAEMGEYLNFLLDPSRWRILGGISGKAGVKMDLLGKNIADYDTTLFNYDEVLKEGDVVPEEKPERKTLVIQPGPEGKDAYFEILNLYKGGSGYSYGPDGDSFKVDSCYREEGFNLAQSFIEFPLSLIPHNPTIISSKLKLFGGNYHTNFDLPIEIRKIINPWKEDFPRNNPPIYSSKIISSSIVNGESWYEWDMTSLIKEWLDNPSSNYGLALISEGNRTLGKIYHGYYFYSSDYSDSSLRPKLEITYE